MGNPSTRESILKEARSCFANLGFVGTSLNDIAAEVGIKRPSLMHHFNSKEHIYLEVLAESLGDWGARVNSSVDVSLQGWDLVDAVLKSSYEFFSANPEVVKIFGREAISPNVLNGARIGQILRPFFQRAVAFLQTEMDAGRLRRHDAENLIVTGYGSLLTYFSDAELLEQLIGSDPLTDAALKNRFNHLRAFFSAALEP